MDLSKKTQLGKFAKPPDIGKALDIPESALQEQCEQYLKILRIPFIRIPDSIYRLINSGKIPINVKLKISQYLKGLPDLTILFKNKYLCVELKSKKGKQTQGQKNFQKTVGDNYYLVRSFDAFRSLVDENNN